MELLNELTPEKRGEARRARRSSCAHPGRPPAPTRCPRSVSGSRGRRPSTAPRRSRSRARRASPAARPLPPRGARRLRAGRGRRERLACTSSTPRRQPGFRLVRTTADGQHPPATLGRRRTPVSDSSPTRSGLVSGTSLAPLWHESDTGGSSGLVVCNECVPEGGRFGGKTRFVATATLPSTRGPTTALLLPRCAHAPDRARGR